MRQESAEEKPQGVGGRKRASWTRMPAFLQEFQDQPEEVRRVFVYVMCQPMVVTGMLRFVGA